MGTRMDAERGKREVSKMFYFDEVFLRRRLYLNVSSVWIISSIDINSERYLVSKYLIFAVVYTRGFVLLDVCTAWARVIIPVEYRSNYCSFYWFWYSWSISPFARAWSTRQPDIGSKSFFGLTFLPKKRVQEFGLKNVCNFGWTRTWKYYIW